MEPPAKRISRVKIAVWPPIPADAGSVLGSASLPSATSSCDDTAGLATGQEIATIVAVTEVSFYLTIRNRS